jgi:uncharacterized membrane protein HdeD (DUF308 family)
MDVETLERMGFERGMVQTLATYWWFLLGALFFAFPGDGAVSLVWLIGVYAIIFGALLVILSFRVRTLRDPQS